MRRMLCVLAALTVIIPAGAAPPTPFRLLAYVQPAGFNHEAAQTSARVLAELGEQTGLWTTTISVDPADLAPARLPDYQVIFFYTSGELPLDDANKAALLQWVRDGGGFIGAHSASDTFYQWPEYGELVGGYFAGHPWTQPVTIEVQDADHPATDGLPARWTITDEIYVHRNWSRDRVKVLMRLDPEQTDWNRQGIFEERARDKDVAIAWCQEYGQGRSFYHALGHFHEVWRDPRMQAQLVGAIKWLRRLDWQEHPAIGPLVAAKDVDGLMRLRETLPPGLRDEPIKALGAIDTPASIARLTALAAANEADSSPVAVRALGRLAGGLSATIDASRLNSPVMRTAAALALSRRTEAAAEARLIELLGDPVSSVGQIAAEALARSVSPTARGALLTALRGDRPAMHAPALAALPTGDQEVRATLLDLLTRAPASHQAVLPAVAARLAPEAARDEVFAALRPLVDQPGDIAEIAARAIAVSGRPEAPALAADWLFHQNQAVARVAAALAAEHPELDLTDRMTPFIQRWMVIGPLPNPGGNSAFGFGYLPEREFNAEHVLSGVGGDVRWKPATTTGNFLNLRDVFPAQPENSACYAYCEITSPAEMTAELRLGSDDGCKVWFNGRPVLAVNAARGLALDQDRAPITLQAGVNHLMVKVLQGGGDWSLSARIARREGGLRDLKFGIGPVGETTAFIDRWRVCGPFPIAENDWSGMDTVCGPEQELKFDATYPNGDVTAAWREVSVPDGNIDFKNLGWTRGDWATAYAAAVINAETAGEYELWLGSDDGVKVWVNGELVHNNNVPRGLAVDQDKVKVNLRAGANALLVKVANGGGGWNLALRVRRAGGAEGLTFALP